MRVLICDDEKDIREVIKIHLQSLNCGCIEASNGSECYAKAQDLHPDIIYLDLSMPNVSGYTAHSMLRGNPNTRHIPVVIITGSCPLTARLMKTAGVIEKPFTKEELILETIQALVKYGRIVI